MLVHDGAHKLQVYPEHFVTQDRKALVHNAAFRSPCSLAVWRANRIYTNLLSTMATATVNAEALHPKLWGGAAGAADLGGWG